MKIKAKFKSIIPQHVIHHSTDIVDVKYPVGVPKQILLQNSSILLSILIYRHTIFCNLV